jgi:NitT/TauT family transport system permease protein
MTTMSKLVNEIRTYSLSVSFIILVVILWEIFTTFFKIPQYLLPSPTATMTSFVAKWPALSVELIYTLEEIIVGFVVGTVVAFGLAVVIASSPLLPKILYPVIIAVQVVPKIALAPVFLVWFGYGEIPITMITALICFFPVLVNSIKGLVTIDQSIADLMSSLYASRRQVFLKVQLPNCIPYLFASLKVAMTFAIIGAIVGEWIGGASHGVGYLMLVYSSNFDTAPLFAGIFLITLVGIVLFAITALFEKLAAPWAQPVELTFST